MLYARPASERRSGHGWARPLLAGLAPLLATSLGCGGGSGDPDPADAAVPIPDAAPPADASLDPWGREIDPTVEEPNQRFEQAYALSEGDNLGFRLLPGDVDWFSFTLTERAFVIIELVREPGALRWDPAFYWDLYDGNGVLIQANEFVDNPSFERVFEPGTYAVAMAADDVVRPAVDGGGADAGVPETPPDDQWDNRYDLRLLIQPVPTGGIAGRVVAPLSEASLLGVHPLAELVPGRAVVTLAPGAAVTAAAGGARMAAGAPVLGHPLTDAPDRRTVVVADPDAGPVGGSTAGAAGAAGAAAAAGPVRAGSAAAAATLAFLARLRARADVAHAEPLYVRRAQAVPQDPRYDQQWHYPFIGLDAAWDITTGSADVVVAVVDSGLASEHPDLGCGRVLPGYDFIDGDGDPTDPLTAHAGHGTHVLGTVGACTDNDIGVAGVDWQASLLPVRVLDGAGLGTDEGVARGIRWAAGVTVPGVPDNPNPADVINLSLGGPGISQTFQDAIDDAVQAGAIVVGAAGNERIPAHETSPAGLAGVIAVGAVDSDRDLAAYSNFGPAIAVMAPGGERDTILSTVYDPLSETYTFQGQVGTSMAAPHVSGVIALMKAARPQLDRVSAAAYLRNTAEVLTGACADQGCGAGLVDAAAAVADAAAGAPLGAFIEGFPTAVDFGFAGAGESYQVTNRGDAAADIGATTASAVVTANLDQTQLGPGASATLELVVDRAGLADGSYRVPVELTQGGQTRTIDAIVRVGAGIADLGDLVVEIHREVGASDALLYHRQVVPYDGGYVFDVSELPDGLFRVGARTPAGDYGSFRYIRVSGGEPVTDVLLELLPVTP